MIATLDYVAQTFDRFNALCFEGSLVRPPMRLSRAHGFLGKLTFTRRRNLLGSVRYADFVLVVSVAFDLAADVLDDTILHEMIHYYILSHQLRDTSTHGRLFRQMMDNINTRHGRHVRISHRTTESERIAGPTPRRHLIAVSHLRSGTTGITAVNPAYYDRLRRLLPRMSEVERCEWYASADTFFDRFPRSRTVKIYRIDPADLDTHLHNATRLE